MVGAEPLVPAWGRSVGSFAEQVLALALSGAERNQALDPGGVVGGHLVELLCSYRDPTALVRSGRRAQIGETATSEIIGVRFARVLER